MRDTLMMNKNTDEEAQKIMDAMGDDNEDILNKLDSIQQSILAGFAALHAECAIFIQDGEFTVPDNIYEITVFACAAGGEYYAGESVVGEKISVTPGEVIPIVVGDAQTKIGEYLYLTEANSELSNNNDILGCGVILGIAGTDGGDMTKGDLTVLGGKGGCGGVFGFGGGGGPAGRTYRVTSSGSTSGGAGTIGTAQTEDKTAYFNGVLYVFSGAENGTAGSYDTSKYDTLYPASNGGNGGNAGGFGAGGGLGGGKGGCDYKTQGVFYGTGVDGANGSGSKGFVCIKWGVDV